MTTGVAQLEKLIFDNVHSRATFAQQTIDYTISTSNQLEILVEAEVDDLLLTLTADIVAAHVSNNSVAVTDLSLLIANVHGALSAVGSPASAAEARAEPKVSIRSSIKPDYIVCLEDGKQMKMLKRHLRNYHDMTPDQYRLKWGLNSDYPMVAPNYAEQRRTLAKSFGLGTQRRTKGKAK